MPAETLDGEALRYAVIGASGDARLRSMLAAADVTEVVASARWEASHGTVQGYAVTVAFCVEDLATLDASPATRDLLEHGFAVAVAAAPTRALTALRTRWNGRGIAPLETYREAARTSVEVSLDEAVCRYRAARGEHPEALAGLRVEEAGDGVHVSTVEPVEHRARQPIEAALAALLGRPATVRWHVR